MFFLDSCRMQTATASDNLVHSILLVFYNKNVMKLCSCYTTQRPVTVLETMTRCTTIQIRLTHYYTSIHMLIYLVTHIRRVRITYLLTPVYPILHNLRRRNRGLLMFTTACKRLNNFPSLF